MKIKFNHDGSLNSVPSQIGDNGTWKAIDSRTIKLVFENEEQKFQFDNDATIATLIYPEINPKPQLVLKSPEDKPTKQKKKGKFDIQ